MDRDRIDTLRASLPFWTWYSRSPHQTGAEQEGAIDLLFGNPHDMPVPGLVETIRRHGEPRDPSWFAYMLDHPPAQEAVAALLREHTGLAWAAEDVALTTGGFGALAIDLTPREGTRDASAPVSAEEGRRLYQAYGCIACHATDAASLTKLGPSWRGLYGSERTCAGGGVRGRADEAYLKESILQPAAKVVEGYERGDVSMPSYAGVLSEAQVESLVAFIRTLR